MWLGQYWVTATGVNGFPRKQSQRIPRIQYCSKHRTTLENNKPQELQRSPTALCKTLSPPPTPPNPNSSTMSGINCIDWLCSMKPVDVHPAGSTLFILLPHPSVLLLGCLIVAPILHLHVSQSALPINSIQFSKSAIPAKNLSFNSFAFNNLKWCHVPSRLTCIFFFFHCCCSTPYSGIYHSYEGLEFSTWSRPSIFEELSAIRIQNSITMVEVTWSPTMNFVYKDTGTALWTMHGHQGHFPHSW